MGPLARTNTLLRLRAWKGSAPMLFFTNRKTAVGQSRRINPTNITWFGYLILPWNRTELRSPKPFRWFVFLTEPRPKHSTTAPRKATKSFAYKPVEQLYCCSECKHFQACCEPETSAWLVITMIIMIYCPLLRNSRGPWKMSITPHIASNKH